ncbi:MAG: phenylalanine--tRNA ligase subunit beta [Alphaproteobacteria bacterium]|nr:phenylalanine--tRNA ligase subunit beta [Alphaproteobacteria bacterium]MBU0796489.1 phenylalanine--tRNA ligase subunit beta [Alphaproteobacteria bacterium]MBU0887636.1 phenylalanine--tRNA ligase subunit beta [Alphaproteobacteria bacterium]MBU1812937.1 phenylalanine--tRNA ligase subunit beta [Alphaproteobacteria bacterium]MBU2090126.1 phenylalanine--tRNA ligase subunit beta [Alphaproteobacteria bacterium]
MKFTLSWLKEHLDTSASLDEIVRMLSMIGLEVEGVEDRSAALAPFTIAHVVSAEQHPDADRLRVCKVDTGTEIVQVVCGAPNARTGMKGVFAPVGSHVPGTGIDLKKGTIRGQESNGMLVSERELGLSDEHDGIIELPADAPLGLAFAKYAGLDDPLIDIAITPNRADCLGVRGVARDLAAAGLGTLRPLDTSKRNGSYESPIVWRRDFPAGQESACPIVVGRHFRNVKNGPSPKWMQARLKAVGLRPISALVDITNYVMMDLGRPLHVYDAHKIEGGHMTIRLARDGETFHALNGKEYDLDAEMIVLGDDHGVDDLAGVMGGERTGVSEGTTEVFLETALFDPIRVAITGRKLGLLSDARYRFERGLDQTSPYWGTDIATRLILEICGGACSDIVVEGTEPEWQRSYTLRIARIAELGGVAVKEGESIRILQTLGFEVATTETTGTYSVTPPPWRGDIIGEADLVEEVLRIHGYDNIPVVPLPRETSMPQPAITPAQRRVPLAKRLLAARGLVEAVTFSFMPSGQAALFGGPVPAEMRLSNPISSDLDAMRPSILGNLLAAAQRNANQGYPDLALFEVGPQFADPTPKGQSAMATGIRAGRTAPRDWSKQQRPVDAFDAKGDLLALLEALGAPTANLQVSTDAPDWYHPGRSGCLRLGPNVLASFGELHPRVLAAYDLKGPVVGFELFLDRVPMAKAKKGSTKPFLKLSPFQPVERDFAFVVEDSVAAEQIVRAAKGADKVLVSEVGVFDIYAGANLGEGKKSVAISVTLQPTDRTLTEEDIEAVSGKIVAQVEKATGGSLRR